MDTNTLTHTTHADGMAFLLSAVKGGGKYQTDLIVRGLMSAHAIVTEYSEMIHQSRGVRGASRQPEAGLVRVAELGIMHALVEILRDEQLAELVGQ